MDRGEWSLHMNAHARPINACAAWQTRAWITITFPVAILPIKRSIWYNETTVRPCVHTHVSNHSKFPHSCVLLRSYNQKLEGKISTQYQKNALHRKTIKTTQELMPTQVSTQQMRADDHGSKQGWLMTDQTGGGELLFHSHRNTFTTQACNQMKSRAPLVHISVSSLWRRNGQRVKNKPVRVNASLN